MRALERRRRSRLSALLLPSAGLWLMFAGIAISAGIARERWLVPRLGELGGHQVGTLLVAVVCLVVVEMFVVRQHLTPREALVIGLTWVLAAIAFEFGFGRYVDGLSWQRLLADYDLSRGRLLLLVWLTIGPGPFLLARWYRT